MPPRSCHRVVQEIGGSDDTGPNDLFAEERTMAATAAAEAAEARDRAVPGVVNPYSLLSETDEYGAIGPGDLEDV